MPKPIKIKLLGDKSTAAKFIPQAKKWLADLTQRRLKAKLPLMTSKKIVGLNTLVTLQSSNTLDHIWIRHTATPGFILEHRIYAGDIAPTGCTSELSPIAYLGRWRVIVNLVNREVERITVEDTDFNSFTDTYVATLYDTWVEQSTFTWENRYNTLLNSTVVSAAVDPDTFEIIPPSTPLLTNTDANILVAAYRDYSGTHYAPEVLDTGFKAIIDASQDSCEPIPNTIAHYSVLNEHLNLGELPPPFYYSSDNRRSVYVNGALIASGTDIQVAPNTRYYAGGYTHRSNYPTYPFRLVHGSLTTQDGMHLIARKLSISALRGYHRYRTINYGVTIAPGSSIGAVSFGTIDNPTKYGTSPPQPGSNHNYILQVLSSDDIYATISTSAGYFNGGFSLFRWGDFSLFYLANTVKYTKAKLDRFRQFPTSIQAFPEPGLARHSAINVLGTPKLKVTIYSGQAASGFFQLVVPRRYPHFVAGVTGWGTTEEIVNIPLPPPGGKSVTEVSIPQFVESETKMVPPYLVYNNGSFDELHGTSQDHIAFRHTAITGELDDDFSIVVEEQPPVAIRVDNFFSAPTSVTVPRGFFSSRTFLSIPNGLGEIPNQYVELNEEIRAQSIESLETFLRSEEENNARNIALSYLQVTTPYHWVEALNQNLLPRPINIHAMPLATTILNQEGLDDEFELVRTKLTRAVKQGQEFSIIYLGYTVEELGESVGYRMDIIAPGVFSARTLNPRAITAAPRTQITVDRVVTYRVKNGDEGEVVVRELSSNTITDNIVGRSEEYQKELEARAVTDEELRLQLEQEVLEDKIVILSSLYAIDTHLVVLGDNTVVSPFTDKQQAVLDHPELTEPADTDPPDPDKIYKLNEEDTLLIKIYERVRPNLT